MHSNLVLMNIVEEEETNLDTIDLWWPLSVLWGCPVLRRMFFATSQLSTH